MDEKLLNYWAIIKYYIIIDFRLLKWINIKVENNYSSTLFTQLPPPLQTLLFYARTRESLYIKMKNMLIIDGTHCSM
jgi:hypothetical protein